MNKDLFKIFKQKRESLKISLEKASKDTNIHINVLRNLEEGEIQNIPFIYLKGFIKIYSQYLGIEPEKILNQLKEETSPQPSLFSEEKKRKLSYGLIKKAFRKGRKAKILKFASIFVLSVLIILSLRALILQINKTISSHKKSKLSSKKITSPKTSVSTKPSKREGLEVVVTAKKNALVLVKVDGKTVFRNILVAGFSEVFKGKKKVYIRAANGSAIEIKVNGKYIGSLSKRNEVKTAVITPKGIKIK